MWLALYVEWQEDIPRYLKKATPEVIAEFDAVIAAKPFSWDQAADFAREMTNRHKEEIDEKEER
jgi:hypothetical protein